MQAQTQLTVCGPEEGAPVPRWDAERRELWFRGQLLLHYTRPAPYGEQVLAAFEAQGWKYRIEDPIHPTHSKVERRHLRGVIKALNAALKVKLIRFHGDGTGDFICWEDLGRA